MTEEFHIKPQIGPPIQKTIDMKTSGDDVENQNIVSESEQGHNPLPENWQPLIPKQINFDVKKPPGCPLKDIQFI